MFLYKYTKIGYAIDILENERLFLSKPNSFNDPFDCLVTANDSEIEKASELVTEFYDFKELYDLYSLKKHCTADEKTKKILERGAALKTTLNLYPFYSKWDLFYKYREEPQSVINKRVINNVVLVHKYLNDFQNTHLICCFSKRYDSILMWSHYADKHTGVCIEFEIPQNEKDIVEVNYKREKTEFKILKVISHVLALEFLNKPYDNSSQQFNLEVMEPLFTKSIDWQYEQEVRYILPTQHSNRAFDENNNVYMKAPPIKSIIIGCRTDKKSENIRRIIELANQKGIEVKFAQPDDHTFELKIR